MSVAGYLLDTNIVIALLTDEPAAVDFFEQTRRDKIPVFFSVITESEVFTGIDERKFPRAYHLFTPPSCIDADSIIALGAAWLRREQNMRHGRKLKTPDALIIATALKHRYALVSRDTDMHFVQAEYGLTHIVI